MKRSILVPALVSISACSPADERSGGGYTHLVGGSPAGDQFPSVIWLPDAHCTAARVGPRHVLTAAHCWPYKKQGKLRFNLQSDFIPPPDDEILEPKSSTVVRETIGPGWAGKVGVAGQNDLLLIEVEQLPDAIATSTIDLNPVQTGDSVTILGNGCETSGSKYASALKYMELTVLGPETTKEPSSALHGTFFITSAQPNGLCRGDSGGPVFRAGSIVGVNSWADEQLTGDILRNGHQRVSAADASWWSQTGASTSGTPSPPAPGQGGSAGSSSTPTGGPESGGSAGIGSDPGYGGAPGYGGNGGFGGEPGYGGDAGGFGEPGYGGSGNESGYGGSGGDSGASCAGYCGSSDPVPGSSPACYCDSACAANGDCCADSWICG